MTAHGPSQAAARRRDRRVYLRAHPLLFALLAATRGRPVRRFGRTVLVHDAAAYREALTRLPLDRTAAGTTGGAARAALTGGAGEAGGVLFDQEGGAHRDGRRGLAVGLGAAGVEELRAVWRPLLVHRLAPLARGGEVDLVELARELSGTVVCALLGSRAEPRAVATAAAEAAAASVRDHLPGPPRPGGKSAAVRTADRLRVLLRPGPATGAAAGSDAGTDARSGSGSGDEALRAMLAVAAVNTTVAALPRAVAWCADAGLWEDAADARLRPVLAGELLRVTAASPLLPRVTAADGSVGGCPVRGGDRLLLVARHAAEAHRRDPDARRPAAPDAAQLVFGAGPHACPGARLARAQLADVLEELAPYRPVVTRARVDRRAALPGWRSLKVRAGA
ncbi:cytochrome P450 [Streptomyces sp. NPDC002467]|uniref:cytochrome P450 n=1 Tax=Streptomyces sp. NPDC002467 TaxID=3364647 RepID=UPI0036A1754F